MRERLRTALQRKKGDEDDTDEEERDADKNDDEDVDDGWERKMPKKEPVLQTLSFKDVEDLMQLFSGDSGQNVRQWLEEFEETSEICI